MYPHLKHCKLTFVVLIVAKANLLAFPQSLFIDGDADITLASGGQVRNSPRGRRWRLEAAKPFLWVHIPKTGTSFVNTLLFTACLKWPKEAVMDDSMESQGIPYLFKEHPLGKNCPGGFNAEYPAPSEGGHYGLSNELFAKQRGHLVGMFRRPQNRIVSAFSQPGAPWGAVATGHHNFTQYALHEKGCMTKSLARDGWYPCKLGSKAASQEEVDMAVSRLQGFAFIGLTEEWNLSVCLFHAVFGGDIYQEEVAVTRPGQGPIREAASQEFLASLKDWEDRADEEVYAAAAKLFWQQIQKYNVRRGHCEQRIQEAMPRRPAAGNKTVTKKTPVTSLYEAGPSSGEHVALRRQAASQNDFAALNTDDEAGAETEYGFSLYGYSLGAGMRDGDAVHIRAQGWGFPGPPDNSFAINLRTISGDIALSYGARYWEKRIVLNSKVGSKWGHQEDVPMWPHAEFNSTINISFVLNGTSWGTIVNGTRLHELDYTYPELAYDPVNKVEVSPNLVNCVVSMSHGSG